MADKNQIDNIILAKYCKKNRRKFLTEVYQTLNVVLAVTFEHVAFNLSKIIRDEHSKQCIIVRNNAG